MKYPTAMYPDRFWEVIYKKAAREDTRDHYKRFNYSDVAKHYADGIVESGGRVISLTEFKKVSNERNVSE